MAATQGELLRRIDQLERRTERLERNVEELVSLGGTVQELARKDAIAEAVAEKLRDRHQSLLSTWEKVVASVGVACAVGGLILGILGQS